MCSLSWEQHQQYPTVWQEIHGLVFGGFDGCALCKQGWEQVCPGLALHTRAGVLTCIGLDGLDAVAGDSRVTKSYAESGLTIQRFHLRWISSGRNLAKSGVAKPAPKQCAALLLLKCPNAPPGADTCP